MASIKMIPEEETTRKAREIYWEIKETPEIEFVLTMYKVMAHKSEYLEANWNKFKSR